MVMRLLSVALTFAALLSHPSSASSSGDPAGSTPHAAPATLRVARSTPQWRPPDPTNLQVLPKDIAKPALIQMMRGFTQSLGVRCEFCHLGEGNDLSTFDFASDERRQKRNARLMIRMMADLNGKYLADVPEPRPAGTPAVTCYTCHRGEVKPQTSAPAGVV